jgi:hypothetical protein
VGDVTKSKSCSNCQHACRLTNGQMECRKVPPRIVDVKIGMGGFPQALTSFPLVQRDWWCSEFFPEAEAPQLLGAVAPEPGREN